MKNKLVVRKQEGSKQYGIYLNDKLVEGGFFNREIAIETAAMYVIAPTVGGGSVAIHGKHFTPADWE